MKEEEWEDTEKKVLDIFRAAGADITPADFSCTSNGRQEKEGEVDPCAICFPEEEERGYAKEEGIERKARVWRDVRV